MKNQLTIAQVNENLQQQFPDKESHCFHAVNGTYVMEFRHNGETLRVMVDEFKKVYVQWPDDRKPQEYAEYCRQNKSICYIRKWAVCGEFIPLIWNTKTVGQDLKLQHQQFLEICGYGKPEKPESDEARIKKLAGSNYFLIYKLIKEVNVKQAFLAMGKLHVVHDTGKFSFLIKNISHPANAEVDRQIRDMFYNLLGLPVTSKQQSAA